MPDRILLLTAVVSLAGTLELTLRGVNVTPWGLVVRQLALALVWWAALRSVWRRPRGLGFILLVALLLRLAALPGAPLFENDFYRYIWEGRVLAQGGNPYAHAPDSDRFEDLRDDVWVGVGYDHVPAAYPPLALWFFALVGPTGLLGLKVLFVLAEFGIMALTIGLLARHGLPRERVILYAWCPLAVKEVAGSAHYDPVVVLLVLAALWSTRWGPALFAAACCMKLYPLVLAPVLFGRRAWLAWAAALGALGLLYLPFLWDSGLATFTGLTMYGRLWEFNTSVFGLLRWLFGRATASAFAALTVAGLVLFFLRHRRAFDARPELRPGACALVLLAYLLTGHVLDPWYLLWVLPWLAFEPFRWALVLVALVPLSYTYWYTETIALGPTVAQFVPVYAVLAWDLARPDGQVRALLRRIVTA